MTLAEDPYATITNIDLIVYPNPTNEFLNIKQSGMFDVELFNMHGNEVFKKVTVSNSLSVNVKDYPAGMYIVKIIDQKGVRMKKFIKN